MAFNDEHKNECITSLKLDFDNWFGSASHTTTKHPKFASTHTHTYKIQSQYFAGVKKENHKFKFNLIILH